LRRDNYDSAVNRSKDLIPLIFRIASIPGVPGEYSNGDPNHPIRYSLQVLSITDVRRLAKRYYDMPILLILVRGPPQALVELN
jgi:hypothetical protein